MSEVKLPEFKVLVGDNETIVRLNGKKIGAAWGPSADGSGAWFAYRYGGDPARFADEKAAKSYLMGVMEMPIPDWAKTKPHLVTDGLTCGICGKPVYDPGIGLGYTHVTEPHPMHQVDGVVPDAAEQASYGAEKEGETNA